MFALTIKQKKFILNISRKKEGKVIRRDQKNQKSVVYSLRLNRETDCELIDFLGQYGNASETLKQALKEFIENNPDYERSGLSMTRVMYCIVIKAAAMAYPEKIALQDLYACCKQAYPEKAEEYSASGDNALEKIVRVNLVDAKRREHIEQAGRGFYRLHPVLVERIGHLIADDPEIVDAALCASDVVRAREKVEELNNWRERQLKK